MQIVISCTYKHILIHMYTYTHTYTNTHIHMYACTQIHKYTYIHIYIYIYIHAQIQTQTDISFHDKFGTFATTGSDGEYLFWCKDSKSKLKANSAATSELMITASAFNHNPTPNQCLFAYAQGYDWSMGHKGYNTQTMAPKIYIHPTVDKDIQNKPKK